jgi:acyl-CoA thioesterase-1
MENMPTIKEPMPKRRFSFELIAAVLLCAGCASARRAENPHKTPVLFLGDSITAGFGVEPVEAFPSLVAGDWKRRGVSCEPRIVGLPMAKALELLDYLPVVLDGELGLVILEIGPNDGFARVAPEEIEKRIAALIEALRAKNAAVALVAMKLWPPAPPDYEAAFEDVYPRLARRYGLKLIPSLWDDIYGKPEIYAIGDGAHPNAAGHEKIAERLESWLAKEKLPSPIDCR